jgi:hypothetical protein
MPVCVAALPDELNGERYAYMAREMAKQLRLGLAKVERYGDSAPCPSAWPRCRMS